jgi:polysaccharide export outer membrane protein
MKDVPKVCCLCRPSALKACVMAVGFMLLLGAFLRPSHAQEMRERPTVVTPTQGVGDPSEGDEPSRPALQRRNPRYQVARGDVLDLTFPLTPEFNQMVTVHPDGFITLTGLGDLYVEGKTVPELRDLLKASYGKILHDPIVNVVLKDFEKPYFIAAGEIGHPGKYELRGDTTLTGAIAIAGGFSENSKHSQVLLFHRVSNDWAEVKVLNVKKMFQAHNLTEDVHLQPGDMFYVPQNFISKVRKWVPYTSLTAGVPAL